MCDGREIYKTTETVIRNWELLSDRLGGNKARVKSFLTAPLLIGSQDFQTSEAVRRLGGFLYGHRLYDRMEEMPFLFHKIDYCQKSADVRFEPMRFFAWTLENASRYHGFFKGCLVLDITAWAEHTKEEYFDVLLCYLSDIRDDIFTIFYMDAGRREKADQIIYAASKYFRVDAVDFSQTEPEAYLSYALKAFDEKNVPVKESAKKELLAAIKKWCQERDFNGYETIARMVDEISFQFYVNPNKGQAVTGSLIRDIGKYSHLIQEPDGEPDVRKIKIGFQCEGERK